MDENIKKPSLRFKGFTDDWEQRKLGMISSILKGQQLGKSSMIDSGSYYVLNGGINLSGYTDNWNTSEDTISISEGGNSCGFVNYNTQKFWSGGHNYTLNNLRIDSRYLYQFLKLNETNIMDLRVGSGLPNIQKSALSELEISYPSNKEQIIIGLYFTELDNLITLHQRKYETLLNVKKSLLQKMFPKENFDIPEIRFKGFTDAWEQRKLGDCVLVQRGGSPRPIQNYLTNKDDGINWIKIGDVANDSRYITSTEEKIIPEGAKNSRFVYKGDLILSNSMSFGRPYIMAINGCIHDGWLLIRDEKKLFSLEYLLELLSSEKMLEQYKSLASGGVVNNLNSQLVQSVSVTYPKIDEQAKIGNLFVRIDTLITLHQRKYEILLNYKKALLQKMFI
jgi:restriction endonuclease S subunit